MTNMQKKNRNLVSKVPEGGVVMKGHQQLGAQQAVAGLLGPYIQPLTLLELAHAQLHHPIIHLRTQARVRVGSRSGQCRVNIRSRFKCAWGCARHVQQTAAVNW